MVLSVVITTAHPLEVSYGALTNLEAYGLPT
jgi:hypothetical protein